MSNLTTTLPLREGRRAKRSGEGCAQRLRHNPSPKNSARSLCSLLEFYRPSLKGRVV